MRELNMSHKLQVKSEKMMPQANSVLEALNSLSAVELNASDPLKNSQDKQRETTVFYGFSVVSIIASISLLGMF